MRLGVSESIRLPILGRGLVKNVPGLAFTEVNEINTAQTGSAYQYDDGSMSTEVAVG